MGKDGKHQRKTQLNSDWKGMWARPVTSHIPLNGYFSFPEGASEKTTFSGNIQVSEVKPRSGRQLTSLAMLFSCSNKYHGSFCLLGHTSSHAGMICPFSQGTSGNAWGHFLVVTTRVPLASSG